MGFKICLLFVFAIISILTHESIANGTNVCSLPIEAGPCRASQPKYAYDSSQGKCVQFTYGGCQGNDNKFNSQDECERACKT